MTFRIASTSSAVAAALALAAVTLGSRGVQATPAVAQQTKLGCPACHVMPPSKDKLTERGQQFKSTGK